MRLSTQYANNTSYALFTITTLHRARQSTAGSSVHHLQFSLTFSVEWRRRSRSRHATEPTTPRTSVAHYHDCRSRRLAAPALSNVGASRLLAYRRQTQRSHSLAQALIVFAVCRSRLEPFWFLQYFARAGRRFGADWTRKVVNRGLVGGEL
jgi:hypothetical protein